jgi:hypothetical protein
MSEERVRAGRDRYLADNSFTLDGYRAPSYGLALGRRTIRLPNPGLLPWHDLHHVATGYGTGLIGEAEISAFELRAGCRGLLVFILCLGAIGLGMLIAPRRIIRAWRLARGKRTLYRTAIAYDELLEMKVVELRQHLGIPAEGLAGITLEVR